MLIRVRPCFRRDFEALRAPRSLGRFEGTAVDVPHERPGQIQHHVERTKPLEPHVIGICHMQAEEPGTDNCGNCLKKSGNTCS